MTRPPVLDPPRVLRYLRRSRGDAHETHCLDNQLKEIERIIVELVERGEIPTEVAGWKRCDHTDDDWSRDDFDGRPGLQSLMDDIRPGDIVIARDDDRLGAGYRTLVILEEMKAAGARIFEGLKEF